MQKDSLICTLVIHLWKDVIKGTGILSIGVVVSNLFMFLYRYVCMISLSMGDYGRLALLISSFNTLIIFAHFNFGTAVIKYWSNKNENFANKNKIYQNSILLSLITSLISFLVLYLIWSHYIHITIPLILILAISILSFAISIINSGFFMGNFKIGYSALIHGSLGISRFFFCVTFLWLFGFKGMDGVVYAFLLGSIIPFLLSITILKTKFTQQIIGKIDTDSSKKIITYSGYIMIAGLIFSALGFYVRWVLSTYSYESIALYDGAFLIYAVIQMLMSTYVMILVLHVSKMASEGKSVPVPSKWDLAILMTVVLAISILFNYTKIDDSLLTFLHLKTYIPSLQIFSILVFTVPFDLYFGTCSGIFQGTGKTKDLAIVAMIAAIFYLIGVPLLIRFLGILGAAIMYIILYIVLDIISLKRIKKLNISIKSTFLLRRAFAHRR